MNEASDIWLAGVDGCPQGWVVAFVRPQSSTIRVRVETQFRNILEGPEAPVKVAVDVPIGLPERAGHGGREAERSVRPLLKGRQSSVFSTPSRAAVYASVGPFATQTEVYAGHQAACQIARGTSEPARGVAIQAFMIFPKVREVDGFLRTNPAHIDCVYETHPEVIFWRLNAESALAEPKKKKSRIHPAGMELRRRLLIAEGLPADAVNAPPPKGAGADDLIDALACAAIALRLHRGEARPFPDPPPRDAFGLAMAIWA